MLNMNYKRHIRYNHQTNHFAYIIDETEKSYLFFGLTHSPRTFRNKNVPLANKKLYHTNALHWRKEIFQ